MKILFASLFVVSLAGLIYAGTGSLDASFGTNGAATVFINGSDMARDVVIQPDNKIIVAGTSQTAGNQDFSLSRLNPDGSLDTNFGAGGKVLTPFDNFDSLDNARAVALQADGKIVLAGTYSIGSGYQIALARYNSDGSLDTSFDGDGKVTTRVNAAVGSLIDISGVAIDAAGKIIAVGTFVSNPGGNSFIAARFSANGTLDTSFGNGGVAVTTVGSSGGQAYTVAVEPDGKIVLGGYAFISGSTTGFALVRYNSDGLLDASFGNQGKVVTSISGTSTQDSINSIVIQPDGKIVAAGRVLGNFADSALARYNPDGSLDSSFGVAGKVINSISTRDDLLSDVALQTDGKLVASGFAWAPTTNNDFLVARYNPDGTRDSSFGIGGFALTSLSTGDDRAAAIALQSDDKVITVGTGAGGFITTRYPKNGFRTFNFDGDGRADLSVFRSSNGVWYLQNSNTGYTGYQFGVSTDRIVPADYDGDDKTDVAVYRDGNWYILKSKDLSFASYNFGLASDIPAPADFDGDGKAELAVYRPSSGYWFTLSLTNNAFGSVQFGSSEDKPVTADYDGDGKSDYAVWRPSNGVWYMRRSTAGFAAVQFGIASDKPTPGDYDGDGRADQAVYRGSGGTWFLNRSRDGFASINFGLSSDIPAPADFDGDGKIDIAVFRPESGTWYQLRTTLGFGAVQFGANGDIPTPAAFVP